VAGKIFDFTAHPADPALKVESRFEHRVDLVVAEPNNTSYYQTRVDKIAGAVTEEAPYKLHIVEPKAPLVQNGSMNLNVVAERAENFHGPISVSLLFKPQGVGTDDSLKIPEDKNEGTIPLSATGEAPPRKWKVAVNGTGNAGKGAIWVCSPFAELEVASPFVTGKIERGYVEQGQSAALTCKLTQLKPFEGTAKIRLANLPAKVSAQEIEITAADQEVQFQVTADNTALPGQKKDLFCVLTFMKEGETVTQNIAQGGVLRIGRSADKK
jgi:hypothetical protein